MSPAVPEKISLLSSALRDAAVLAAQEPDPVLREMAAAMGELGAQLGRHATVSAQAQAALPAGLLGLYERLTQLRLLLQAEACLVHADPPRARTAAQLLLHLPLPDMQAAAEEATVGGVVPVSLDSTLGLLRVTDDLLMAVRRPAVQEALHRLGLLWAVEGVAVLQKELLARAAQVLPASPSGEGDLLAEAMELCARFRAYVIVATGKLSRRGDDPTRRQRLLSPLSQVPPER